MKIRGDWEKFKYGGAYKISWGFEKMERARLSGGLLQRGDEMLQVTGKDLIAKEFKMHLTCYKEYTRVCSKQSLGGVSSLSVDEGSENETRTANNFKTVRSFIVDHVIGGHQSVSIKVL